MIEIKELSDPYRPSFETLIGENWQQTWGNPVTRQIVQWRYYDRPGEALTWLAFDGDKCVAMLDSVVRRYLLDGREFRIRETADWYCTPSYRPYGIGVWLLRKAIGCPEPILVLGGSDDNNAILSRLHWTELPPATSYVLPVRARGLIGNVVRRKWPRHERMAKVIPNILPGKSARRIAAPLGRRGEMRLIEQLPDLLPPIANGLIELIDSQHLAWMLRMPMVLAKAVALIFLLDDELVGLSLSQIEPTAYGCDGKIVHVQCRDETALAWIMSETTRFLIDSNVGFIRSYVSTPVKRDAIEQVGFVKSKEVRCHWWPGKLGIVPQALDVGYLRGDDAMPFHALRSRGLDR